MGCKGLTSFDLSGATRLKTIGPGAFKNCDKLERVLLPSILKDKFENSDFSEKTFIWTHSRL